VLVIHAPNERELARLLARVDRVLFKTGSDAGVLGPTLPLEGRKLQANTDWGRE
jgi:hypothetical protein